MTGYFAFVTAQLIGSDINFWAAEFDRESNNSFNVQWTVWPDLAKFRHLGKILNDFGKF